MIEVVLLLDLSDPLQVGAFNRRLKAIAPDGHIISELRCTAWGRNPNTGRVDWDFAFRITIPPRSSR